MDSRQHSRRRFLWSTGACMALGAVGRHDRTATFGSELDEPPLFQFVQWNDVHVDATQPPGYQLANEKMKYLVNWINDPKRSLRPDFVVGVGDMIHGGVLRSLSPDTQLQKRLQSDLCVPFYPVVGNHENVQREGDPEYEAAYRSTFGEDRTNYTLKHKGFYFIMLNNSGAPSSNARGVGQRRNEWLRGVLDASTDMPKIVCCHIPLVPIRDEPVLKKSFGFVSYAAKDEQLLSLVDKYADSIVAVLSGHLHLTGVAVRNGVQHICISGTASYPCDFASYDVFPDRVRLRVHSLPKQLLTPDTNIHGRPRHGVDYTDTEHPTHESYIRGNPSERELDIDV